MLGFFYCTKWSNFLLMAKLHDFYNLTLRISWLWQGMSNVLFTAVIIFALNALLLLSTQLPSCQISSCNAEGWDQYTSWLVAHARRKRETHKRKYIWGRHPMFCWITGRKLRFLWLNKEIKGRALLLTYR